MDSETTQERLKRNRMQQTGDMRVRTLSTASLISRCPGFEIGTLWKASLPPPLLIGYRKHFFILILFDLTVFL